MHRTLRALAGALLLAAAGAAPAGGQRLLDWTVRTTARPEALTEGAGAVFWNPAAIGTLESRAEVMVLALQTPDAMGLRGLAAAGTARLRRGTTVAVGYQHFGIDDIGVAGLNSPPTADDPGGTLAVTEDRLSLAAAQPLARDAWIGAMVQYERADDATEIDEGVAFGAGALFRFSAPLRPTLGGSAAVVDGATRWTAGVEVTPPGAASLPVTLRAGYGLAGASDRSSTPSHRLALRAGWRGILDVAAGAAGEPSGGATDWRPAASAGLRLGRYLLGVVREPLAAGFGAAYAFHLDVRF